VSSLVQTRGSIPLFWTQKVDLTWKPKPKVIADPNSIRAFDAHFYEQKQFYGKQTIVNLIDHRGAEAVLETAYKQRVEEKKDEKIRYTAFDFHHSKNLDELLNSVTKDLDANGAFAMKDDEVFQQTGNIRTNCMDNLDRTNVAQSLFARYMLAKQLNFVEAIEGDRIENYAAFYHLFRNVWADNADVISVQYSGTGALKTDVTRTGKKTKLGMLNDGINALTRWVLNNLHDGSRQDGYSLFLGYYQVDPKQASSPFSRQKNRHRWSFYGLVGLVGFLLIMGGISPLGGWGYKFFVALLWAVELIALQQYLAKNGPELVDQPALPYTVKEKTT